MVGIAQLAEHKVVVLGAEGSSPSTHPIKKFAAPVAQLDRASDFESAGRGFESLRARQLSNIRSRRKGNSLVLRLFVF